MSNVSVNLTANTSAYVQRIRDAKTETDRNIIKMEQRIDQFAQDVNKNFTSVGGAIDTMLGGLRTMKGGGYVAAVAGIGYAAASAASGMKQLATETVEAQKIIKIAAERSRVSAKEMQMLGAVTSTVGLDMEKFGDINKDVFDKLGDYITTGGGAFVDFFDAVKGKSTLTAQELQRMSGPEVLQAVVEEMEKANVSGAQMTWVLESIGSDASNLLPLLRNGAKEFKSLQERMKEVSETPLLIKEAEQEVHVLNAAFASMWDSFGVMMTNKMEGTFGWMTKIAAYANKMFNDEALEDMGERFAEGLSKREHKINTDSNAETLRQEKAAIEYRLKNNKGDGTSPETKRALLQAEKKLQDLTQKSTGYGGFRYHEQAKQQAKAVDELKAKLKSEQEDFVAYTNGLLKSYDNAIDSKEKQSKAGGGTGKENLDKIEKVDKGMNAEDAAKEMADAKKHELAVEKELAKQKEELAEYQKSIELEANAEVRKDMEKTLADKKRTLDDTGKLLDAWKTKQENITKDQTEQTKKKTDTEKKAADAKSREEEKAQRDAERKRRDEMQKQLDFYQQELSSAVTNSEKIVALKNLEFERIRQLKQLGRITDEQESEMQHIALTKQFESEFALKEANYASEHEFEMANAEARKDWLLGQWQDGFITEEQWRQLDLEAETDYTNAKNNLRLSQLSVMANAVDGMSGLFEQGTKEQKIAFAAEKAIRIAETSMLMEANAVKAKNSAGSGIAGEIAAVASRIADGAAIASMVSTSIGQFHNGSDEVDQTGSYILKQGERVVQPAANKDLTAFLESNKNGGGEIKVDAPMIIQGDTNIDEKKFAALLVQHRETVTKAVKAAQRENPGLR